MNSSHAFTMDGSTSAQFWDDVDPSETIGRVLSTMDGGTAFAFSIWEVPEGADWRDLNLDNWPIEYMQAAGSAEAMTIEIRRLEDGIPCQYTVGRGGARGPAADQVIAFGLNGRETRVFADEIFAADEAGEIFRNYFDTKTVQKRLVLRLLDLTFPVPESTS